MGGMDVHWWISVDSHARVVQSVVLPIDVWRVSFNIGSFVLHVMNGTLGVFYIEYSIDTPCRSTTVCYV